MVIYEDTPQSFPVTCCRCGCHLFTGHHLQQQLSTECARVWKSSLASSQPSPHCFPNARLSPTCRRRMDNGCKEALAQLCLSPSQLAQCACYANAPPPLHANSAQPDHTIHAGHVHIEDRPLRSHAKLALPLNAQLAHPRHCHPAHLPASSCSDEEGEGEHW